MGLYSELEEDDSKLETVERISKASTLVTKSLLSYCFPVDGPAPASCTAVDMGSGYGGTARVAAREYGCRVILRLEGTHNGTLGRGEVKGTLPNVNNSEEKGAGL